MLTLAARLRRFLTPTKVTIAADKRQLERQLRAAGLSWREAKAETAKRFATKA